MKKQLVQNSFHVAKRKLSHEMMGKKMDGKLSFTQMKILNDIACNLISIEFNSISFHFIPNSIELNSIESKNIELEFN
jgi:hypothetical protein